MRALVTGAARGIGAAITARLRADGFDVVTLDREPGCDLRLDLRTDEVPDQPDVDVCVSNAAITNTVAPAHRMTDEQWQRDVDVNLTGAYKAVRACLAGMLKTIAAEKAHKGITANAILPGMIATEVVRSMPPPILERVTQAQP